MTLNNKVPCYLLHCKDLIERKQAVLNQLGYYPELLHLEKIIEEYDGRELTKPILDQYYNRSSAVWKTRCYNLYDINQHPPRELSKGEISLAIKHGIALKYIAESDHEFGFILEDDVVLCGSACANFETLFRATLNECPDDWDIMFPGTGAGLIPENPVEGKYVYEKSGPASRCTDSILIKKEAAKKIYSTWFPITIAADFEYSYHIHLHNLKTYWWHPGRIIQGSEIGYYESSLR